MNRFNYGNQVCKHFDKLYRKREYVQYKRYDNLIWQFKKRYHVDSCNLASASGRVEVIGNHTDHNGGKVIGCAVNLDIVAAFNQNNGSKVRLVSEGYSAIEFDVSAPPQISGGAGLAEGVVAYLQQAGYSVGGFDIFSNSSIPSGAGISSSAAFEMLIATIINECFNSGSIPLDVMAKAGQYAEKEYLNKPCGLLDQGASLAGGMTKFDFNQGFACSNVDTNADIRFVLVDTGKSHAGLSHLYASIPAEMFSVAQYFGKERLIEIQPQQLYDNEQAIRNKLGDRPYLRAKHFFEENERVEQMSTALQNGDVDEVIRLVNASGDSSMYQLQNCAVDEQDTAILDAITYARSLGNVGARVHGGGFAGTILCVVRSCDFNTFVKSVSEKYGKKHVLPMTIRPTGATVL